MRHELKKLKLIYNSLFVIIFLIILGAVWFFSQSFLTIDISPRSAKVTVDNAPLVVKTSGIAKKTFKPGKHTIRAEADGYIGYQADIVLTRGRLKTISITLTKAPEALSGGGLITTGNALSESYYLGDNGTAIYRAILGINNGDVSLTENRQITPQRLSDVKELIWSPDKDLALIRKSDKIDIFDFKKYNFISQTELFWGKDIGSIAWAPDNSEIAYYYAPAGGEKSLMLTNQTNTATERVFNFADSGIDKPVLKWSSDSHWLLIIPKNRDISTNKLYLFDAFTRTMKQITETGNQVDAIFSTDAKQIIYATYSIDPNETMPYAISLMSVDGSNQRSLDVRADLRKFAWFKDGKNALMVSYNETAGKDYIFKFNTETKEKSVAVNNIENGKIDSLALIDDDQIMMYSSAGEIYGLSTEVFK
ncbi:MAG: hypothetical protein WCO23_03140 [bacterium]